MLRFRANSGDEDLKRHLLNSPRNATYLSPEIQNEVIEVSASIVEQHIASKVNKAPCFSVLADETMDVAGTEQLSVCLRYVNDDSPKQPILREDFVGFVPLASQTAENLADDILLHCSKLRVDMKKCVGQGYDGAAAMSVRLNGVQARIRRRYPKARYVHCASHRLNLALSDSLSTPVIRNLSLIHI